MDQHCRRHHAFIVLLPLLLHSPFLLLPSSLSSASLLYVPHSIVALSSFSPHLFISPLLQYIPSLLFSFSFMSLPSSYLSPLLHTSSILLSTPLFLLSIIYLPPHPPQSPCMLSHLSCIPLFTLPLSTIIFSLFPPPPLWRHPSSGSSSKARIYILIYQFPAAVEAVMDGVLPAPQRCHELPW